MARPRKDQEDTAVQRLQAAFWEALADMPYHKITVTELVGRAHVNRNAFYYHYEDIHALTLAAIREEFDAHGVARALVQGIQSGSVGFDQVVESRVDTLNDKERLRHALLLCGPNSSQELIGMLSSSMRTAWLQMLGLEEGDLGEEDRLVLDFTLGGIIAILPRWLQMVEDGGAQSVAQFPLVKESVQRVLAIGARR